MHILAWWGYAITYGWLQDRLCEPYPYYLADLFAIVCIWRHARYIYHSTFGRRNGPLYDLRNGPLYDLKNRPLLDPKNRPLLDPKNRPLLDPKNRPLLDPNNWPLLDPNNWPLLDPNNWPLLDLKNWPLLDSGIGSLLDRRIGPLLHCSIAKTARRAMFGRATSRATVELEARNKWRQKELTTYSMEL
jgi:hypothetical protein